jgi:hypothetical protein
MNITISRIPGTTDYDVWINSTRIVMTMKELKTLTAVAAATIWRGK